MARHTKLLSLRSLVAILFVLINCLLLWGTEVRTNQLYLRYFVASTTGDTTQQFQLERNLSTSLAPSVSIGSDGSTAIKDERINDDTSPSSSDAASSQDGDELLHRHLIPKYSSDSIARTIHALVYIPGSLLIYNPVDDNMLVYSVSHSNMPVSNVCRRCRTYVPILARSLWQNQRLSPDQAPLQLFFSEGDFPYVDMERVVGTRNDTKKIDEGPKSFCPWVQFGSVFRDSTILPTVHAFPFAQYMWCVEEWIRHQQSQPGNASFTDLAANTTEPNRLCRKWRLPLRPRPWYTLIPQLIWRGSDYACLHTLRHEDFRSPYTVPEFPFFPRRLAVNMSANGETWFDASIPSKTSPTALTNSILSKYKYQVDIAGAGGTTWTGTLEKLAMTGLLFHHETPAKDWFYDSFKAWEHFVPIRTDLSDLKERYIWAEEHQDEAQAIADRGRAFVRSLVSYRSLQNEYQTYFGQSGVLSKIVEAYDNPFNATLESIVSEYREKWNLTLNLVSICNRVHCDTRHTHGNFWRVSLQDVSCDRCTYHGRTSLFGQNLSQCID
jgi:hypothetical protein